MKVILCDNGLPGLIRFRYDVIFHFLDKGDDVLLVFPKCTESSEWLSLIPRGARYQSIDFNPSSTNPINDIFYLIMELMLYKMNFVLNLKYLFYSNLIKNYFIIFYI